MSRKDFNKGMEAGAKPFEEKFKLQNDAIDRIGENLNTRLNEFDSINDIIINDLTSIEKKRLYDLNTVVDIDELDGAEKELLIALIYTVSNMSDTTTELQKYFVRSVQNYLDIKSPQTGVDLTSIENIENISSQKAILQTLMEFLFLENANHKYLEDNEDILSYFSVNKRGIAEIREKIDVIYNATGLEGIAENYGYLPEEQEYDLVEDTIGVDKYDVKNILGNTLYNIKSGGLIASQGDWIYYSNFEDGGLLYKSKLDGADEIKIIEDEAININVSGQWIYYEIKNIGIYRIKTDGTERTRIISTKEIVKEHMYIPPEDIKLEFWVVEDNLFVIDKGNYNSSVKNPNVYSLALDGSKVEELFIAKDIFAIDEKSIYYFANHKKFYRYDIGSKNIIEIASYGHLCKAPIIFMDDKLYFNAYELYKFLFMDQWSYWIETIDTKTGISRNILGVSGDSYDLYVDNIINGDIYHTRGDKIVKYKPENPKSESDVYNYPEGENENISLSKLHVINNSLYFVVESRDRDDYDKVKWHLDHMEI